MRTLSVLALLVSTGGASAVPITFTATATVSQSSFTCSAEDCSTPSDIGLPNFQVGDVGGFELNLTGLEDYGYIRFDGLTVFGLQADQWDANENEIDITSGDFSFRAVDSIATFDVALGDDAFVNYFDADDFSPFSGNSFYAQDVTFELSDVESSGLPETTPVPLPASGLLLLAGVGGLGVWRRRKAA